MSFFSILAHVIVTDALVLYQSPCVAPLRNLARISATCVRMRAHVQQFRNDCNLPRHSPRSNEPTDVLPTVLQAQLFALMRHPNVCVRRIIDQLTLFGGHPRLVVTPLLMTVDLVRQFLYLHSPTLVDTPFITSAPQALQELVFNLTDLTLWEPRSGVPAAVQSL